MPTIEFIANTYYNAREGKQKDILNEMNALLISELKESPVDVFNCNTTGIVGIALFYTCHHSKETDSSCSAEYTVRLMSAFWCLLKASKIEPKNLEISRNIELLLITHPVNAVNIYQQGANAKYRINDPIKEVIKLPYLHDKVSILKNEIMNGTIAGHEDYEEYCEIILLGCEVGLKDKAKSNTTISK